MSAAGNPGRERFARAARTAQAVAADAAKRDEPRSRCSRYVLQVASATFSSKSAAASCISSFCLQPSRCCVDYVLQPSLLFVYSLSDKLLVFVLPPDLMQIAQQCAFANACNCVQKNSAAQNCTLFSVTASATDTDCSTVLCACRRTVLLKSTQYSLSLHVIQLAYQFCVLAEAQCCSILQSIGFSVTPGIPVFIVDTNGQSVAGGGTGQDGQATNGNNGQNSQSVPMQMCTCSAGVTNATYSGSGKIRLRGGNNSGQLFALAHAHCGCCWHAARQAMHQQ